MHPHDSGIAFSLHTAPAPDGGTAITIYGELDLATVPQVRAALDQALQGEGDVVIDLRACTFVDSTGIAVLAAAALELSERERRLVLRGVRERVMRTFNVAGLTSSSSLEIEPWGAGEERPADQSA